MGTMKQTLDHRYRLLEVVGEGGASTVFSAMDLQTGELRAVKRLDPARDSHASPRRFAREARALLHLQHPNILPLYDVVLGENPYLVTELCTGETLRHRLERHGPLQLHQVYAVGVSILGALQAAHDAGIVHRDVKPGNLLIRDDGTPVLADFGIAILASARRITEGHVVGTFAFMAPEQRMGSADVDGRADLYSLGATLYTLATGLDPSDLFVADETHIRWRGLPSRFVSVLRQATAYRPENRYADARSMQTDLCDLMRGLPIPGEACVATTHGVMDSSAPMGMPNVASSTGNQDATWPASGGPMDGSTSRNCTER